MVPNVSQGNADGCLWIGIDPDCPELCAGVGAIDPGLPGLLTTEEL